MRLIPLTLGILFLQAPAKADKFWLADPANQKTAVEGSSPDFIEGVLIAESDEGYHIRIVGGEVLLPKTSVFKIEKNALSIDDIVNGEKAAASANEAANHEREMANAAAERHRQVRAVEASAAKRSEGAAPSAVQPFDPVIGVVPSPETLSDEQLQRELQFSFSLTRDRRYLKTLRQLRRLR